MLRLLIIDDEIDICNFVKSFFKERKFEVLTAYDGEAALEIVRKKNPDIALLDIRMPVMDGMETLKEIRKFNKHMKVIIVTAVDDTEKAEEAKNYGATEYITKPLLLEQLERVVFSAAKQVSTR